MPNWYLGVVLVTAPFFIKIAPVIAPSLSWLFFIKLVSIVSVCLWGVSVKRKEVYAAALCVAVACFVSSDPYGHIAFIQMDTALSCLLFFAFIMSHKINRNTVYKSLGAICLIQCAWLFLNYLGYDPVSWWLSLFIDFKREVLKPGSYVVNGSLGHINHSAALIAITMPFLKKRFWPIPVAALLAFGSTLPIVCGLLSIAFVLAQKYEKIKYVWLSILAMAFASIKLDSSIIGTNYRLKAWLSFWDWHNHSIIGNGFGYVARFGDYFKASGAPEKFHQLHNELLELYAVFGLLGVAAATYLLKPIIKKKIIKIGW